MLAALLQPRQMEALLHAARSFLIQRKSSAHIRQSRIYLGREQSFAHSGYESDRSRIGGG